MQAGLVLRARRIVQGQSVAAVLFLAPAMALLFVTRIAPVVNAVLTSLRTKGLLVTSPERFVGLDNYRAVLGSDRLVGSFITTLKFVAIIVPLQTLAALALAVLLVQPIPGVRLWRTMVFLPVAVPIAVSTVVWGVIYRPEGPLNALLAAIGIPAQPFLTSSTQALPSIIVLASWIGVGYWMTFLIAGLNDIPVEYREAAAVDGATAWQAFRHVVLPLLRRPLTFVVVSNTAINFSVFVPVQVLTRGGPERSTNLIMYAVYEQAYTFGNPYMASTVALMVAAVLLAIVVIQFRLLGEREG